jgi:putative transposase
LTKTVPSWTSSSSPGATPKPAKTTRFFRQLLKGLRYVPRVVVTGKLRSYGAAHSMVMPSVEHRSSKYLNTRAENSHQPTGSENAR